MSFCWFLFSLAIDSELSTIYETTCLPFINIITHYYAIIFTRKNTINTQYAPASSSSNFCNNSNNNKVKLTDSESEIYRKKTVFDFIAFNKC